MPPWGYLISQGPLGLLACVFLWLYIQERKKLGKREKDCTECRERQHTSVDTIRLSQIDREKEFTKTLEDYGRQLADAVERAEFLATELRRIYKNDTQ